jgi:hypothetical protein
MDHTPILMPQLVSEAGWPLIHYRYRSPSEETLDQVLRATGVELRMPRAAGRSCIYAQCY